MAKALQNWQRSWQDLPDRRFPWLIAEAGLLLQEDGEGCLPASETRGGEKDSPSLCWNAHWHIVLYPRVPRLSRRVLHDAKLD